MWKCFYHIHRYIWLQIILVCLNREIKKPRFWSYFACSKWQIWLVLNSGRISIWHQRNIIFQFESHCSPCFNLTKKQRIVTRLLENFRLDKLDKYDSKLFSGSEISNLLELQPYPTQRCRKVKQFGGANGGRICPPGWNRVNWSAKNCGGQRHPWNPLFRHPCYLCADHVKRSVEIDIKYWNCRRILNHCFLFNFKLKKSDLKKYKPLLLSFEVLSTLS